MKDSVRAVRACMDHKKFLQILEEEDRVKQMKKRRAFNAYKATVGKQSSLSSSSVNEILFCVLQYSDKFLNHKLICCWNVFFYTTN